MSCPHADEAGEVGFVSSPEQDMGAERYHGKITEPYDLQGWLCQGKFSQAGTAGSLPGVEGIVLGLGRPAACQATTGQVLSLCSPL